MTRIVQENGKLILKSFSYFGPGGEEEAAAEMRKVVQRIEEHNRKAAGEPRRRSWLARLIGRLRGI
jgi:hypothetical protein